MDEKLADLKRRLDADPDNLSLIKQYASLKSRSADKEELMSLIGQLIAFVDKDNFLSLIQELIKIYNKQEGLHYHLTESQFSIGDVSFIGHTRTTSEFDPTPTDDLASNFQVGSQWVNTRTGSVWICVDETVGQAQWNLTTGYQNSIDIRPGFHWDGFEGFGIGGVIGDPHI